MAKTRFKIAAVLVATLGTGAAWASTLIPQTVVPGACIPQFATPLLSFGPGTKAALPRVDALKHPVLTIKMKESNRPVLPPPTPAIPYPSNYFDVPSQSNLVCPTVTIDNTRIWAYETSDGITGKVLGPAFWPAVTLEIRRNIPTLVNYVNELPSFDNNNPTGPGMLQGLVTVDQTIDLANPYLLPNQMACAPPLKCNEPYVGAVPSVPHLHGGEVPPQFDGGPSAWFTSALSGGFRGPTYSSLWPVGAGKALYFYNNTQEAGTPWFHDHSMGATRTNVYSGLAGFYFIRDPAREPANLPQGDYEVEMAIQDRQFDNNSQLFFPDGSGADAGVTNLNGTPGNPSVHPFWIPEFFGDVAVVNGSPWPVKEVEPRRYRFRIVEGSNARMYNMTFLADNGSKAPVYVIGSDDGYLNKPVPADPLFMAPGERYDVIVDFTGLTGRTITVTNDAAAPFPSGMSPVPYKVANPGDNCFFGFPSDNTTGMCPADQPTMAKIMQFKVVLPLLSADKSCNPSALSNNCSRPVPYVRLTDGKGNAAAGINLAALPKRQLILKEHAGPGGPLEVLVNNTYYMGNMSPSVKALGRADGVTELPRVGTTELWEIINLTMDAHPMHTHLAQFQVLDRQTFNDNTMVATDPNSYPLDWAAAFGPVLPAFCDNVLPDNPCPGYGPPAPYNLLNGDGALGGNPALSPYLSNALHPPAAPAPWESGWKDTAKAYPGQVMRMLVRFAPTSASVASATPGKNLYPFDPTVGDGYVWHCHIIDHEDNDMMRPYKVIK
ncbi:MAG TPA: multicopper oxidase domain-containing protein [Candidatus Deferrimicrobiaceae bacterium]|jgi:FtsP/CotA-like multicopper oxidase with cupredoxin domain